MSIDLHIHSTFSDGTMSPTELVELAKFKRLKTISITDHDTMAGVGEALTAGAEAGVEVIPGLEISVEHAGKYMHILGYYMDVKNPELLKSLEVLQVGRAARNNKILEKLAEYEIFITPEEVRKISRIGQTGRPHIAQAMLRQKKVKNMNEAFKKYLRKGECAYVSRFVYTAKEAIEIINGAGGLAVLAHPVQIDSSMQTLPLLLEELTAFGLTGIETYYPTHSSKAKKQLRKLATKYNLILTGGSDYHGDIRANTSLAGGKRLNVPYELVGIMKERVQSLTNI